MKPKEKKISQYNAPQSIFVLAILTILGFLFYYSKGQRSITISEKRFEKMMLEQEVKSVTLITNQHLVEVLLQPNALAKENYQKELREKIQLAIK